MSFPRGRFGVDVVAYMVRSCPAGVGPTVGGDAYLGGRTWSQGLREGMFDRRISYIIVRRRMVPSAADVDVACW